MNFKQLLWWAGLWAGLHGCATTTRPADPAPAPAPVVAQGQLIADGVPAASDALGEALRPYRNMRPAVFHS